MDYQKYAKELICYMVENEQNFKFCNHDVSEIARGEGAVLIYLMDDHDGVNASEISQRFDINTSRVAAVLNALSKKGYKERVVDLQDKRKIKVFITDKGRIFAQQRRTEIEDYFKKMLEMLGEEDTKEYLRLYRKVNQIIKALK